MKVEKSDYRHPDSETACIWYESEVGEYTALLDLGPELCRIPLSEEVTEALISQYKMVPTETVRPEEDG